MDFLISISEMAKLHGITRQTLIYYDEINLFKPVQVDTHGYRLYSRRQIPYLREICFLRAVGVKVKEILEHFKERGPKKERKLLHSQKDKITAEIARLNKMRESINMRMAIYEEAEDAGAMQMKEPFLTFMPARKILFLEYLQPINKENLHSTLMNLWRQIFKQEHIPSSGFGSLFTKEAVEKGISLAGAGSFIFLPTGDIGDIRGKDIPEGQYVCLYKYGMPYDIKHLEQLRQWIKEHDYELIGDILDVCLLDTTFYKENQNVDFCMLQAPVKKIEKDI